VLLQVANVENVSASQIARYPIMVCVLGMFVIQKTGRATGFACATLFTLS
jgi:hypothetical protein